LARTGNVRVSITGDSSGLARATSRAEGSLGKLDRAGKKTGTNLAGAGKKIAGLATGILAIGGGAATLKDAIKTTEDMAKGTAALSRLTGLDTKTASEWVEIAKVRGVQSKALNVGFITLSKNIKGAGEGSKKAADMFKELGVSQADIKKGDVNDILLKTSDAFSKMPDGANKTALATKLFGKQAQTLLPLLNEGSGALQDQLGMVDKYGASMDKNGVKKALDAVAAQRKLKIAMDGLKILFAEQVLPVVTKVAGALAEFIAGMRNGDGAGGRFAAAIKPLITAAKDAWTWFSKLSTTFKTVIGAGVGLAAAFAIGGPVGLAIAAIAGGAFLIIKNWSAISGFFRRTVAQVKQSLGISEGDMRQFGRAVQNIGTFVKITFDQIIMPVVRRVLPAVAGMFKSWFGVIGGVIKVFSGLFTGDWKKMFQGLVQIQSSSVKLLLGAIRALTAPFRELWSRIISTFTEPWGRAWRNVKSTAQGGVRSVLSWISGTVDNFGALGTRIVAALVKPFNTIKDTVTGLVYGAWVAVKGVINGGIGRVNSVIRAVNSLPDVSTPFGSIGFPNLGTINPLARGGRITSPAVLVGEEAPLHNEYVISTNPRDRSRMVPLVVEAAQRLGMVGFAKGKDPKKLKANPNDTAAANYSRGMAASQLTPETADDINTMRGRILELTGSSEEGFRNQLVKVKGDFSKIDFYAGKKVGLILKLISARNSYKKNSAGWVEYQGRLASAYQEVKQLLGDLDEIRKPAEPAEDTRTDEEKYLTPAERAGLDMLEYNQAVLGANDDTTDDDPAAAALRRAKQGILARLIRDKAAPTAFIKQFASGIGGPPSADTPDTGGSVDTTPADTTPADTTPAGPTPDQTALIDQANRRAAISARASQLAGNFIQAAFGSGDIGSGQFRNAFGAAAYININTLHPGDPGVLTAIGQAAAAGFGLQGATSATVAPTGI
jgi:hypothetical protein